MPDLSHLPDDTPVADAAEQARPLVEYDDPAADPEAAVAAPAGVPLEAPDHDWQEQKQIVDIDPEEDTAHD